MDQKKMSLEARTKVLIESGWLEADELWFEALVRLPGGDRRNVLFWYEAPLVTGKLATDQVSTSRVARQGRLRALKDELKRLYKVEWIDQIQIARIRHCATGTIVHPTEAT